MPSTSETASENLSSTALRIFFARSAKLLLLTSLIGALSAFALAYFQHPQWTAKMTVQIGQVTAPASSGLTASKLIEAQLTAADRYNLPSFRLSVLKEMKLPAPDADSEASALIFDSLRAAPAKSPDLLNVQVTALSPEQALSALSASFKVLASEHEKVFVPTVSRMKADLADSTAKLVVAEQEYTRTYNALKSGGATAQAGSHDLFATNILAVISAQVLALNQRKVQFEEGLETLRTYPTRVLGELYVPQRPSSPGKLLYVVAGAAIGLMAGLMLALLRNSRRA